MIASPHGPLRVGVGGPVGSGKTALMDALCKHFRNDYDIAAITNDIYTKEDAEFSEAKSGIDALVAYARTSLTENKTPAERIRAIGVSQLWQDVAHLP